MILKDFFYLDLNKVYFIFKKGFLVMLNFFFYLGLC